MNKTSISVNIYNFREPKTFYSSQEHEEKPTRQEKYLLRSLQKANIRPGDLLVLASRLNNDPAFSERFKKNIYGFRVPEKHSSAVNNSQR